VKNLPTWAFWVLTSFLSLVFVLTGLSKLAGPSAVRWAARFANWGYPAFTRDAVGCLEILGGVGLVLNFSRRPAALVLTVLMLGALCTHLIHGESVRLIAPTFLGAQAFVIYWQDTLRSIRRR
jgi:putative oxidoreductase